MSEKFDIEKHITFRKKRINQATISNPLLPGLAVVEINPTELCNRTCSFCPRSNPEVYPNLNLNMPVAVAERLSSQLKEANYDGDIHITGFGEPTLNKNIIDIVKVFSKHFYTTITSNGDNIMSGKLKLDDIIEAKLSYLTVDCYDGDEHYSKIVNKLKELDNTDVGYRVRDHYDDGSSTLFDDYNFNNRGGILGEVKSIKRPCFFPMYKAMVDWNGDLLLCCNDWSRKQIGLGNVNKKDFPELWNSIYYNSIRRALLKGDRKALPACAGCNVDGCMAGEDSANLYREKLVT